MHVEQRGSGPGTMHCTSHVGVQERCIVHEITFTKNSCSKYVNGAGSLKCHLIFHDRVRVPD